MVYKLKAGDLPRGFDPTKHFYCLVCKQIADRQATSKEQRKIIWFHDGRRFPCVKKLPAIPGQQGQSDVLSMSGPSGDMKEMNYG